MLPAEILADAAAALTAGEADRGLHLVDHLLRTFPGHLRARTLRAQALLELGEADAAAADAATVLSVDLLNVDALLISACLADAQGDLHQSHALIGRAASIEPGHTGVRKVFADSVTMLPRDSAALGLSYLSHGWPDLAERELRAALARDSSRVDLRVGLAEALWQQGRNEEARPECRMVLDHNPNCLRATLMMAHILAEQGRTAHGVEMLERAGDLDPEFTIAAELYAKATLSRLPLPAPPSVPEPPPYVDAAAAAQADDDTAAGGGGEEGVFTPVGDPDADAADDGAKSRADTDGGSATEDDEIVASDAAVEEDEEPAAADDVVAEPTLAADDAASESTPGAAASFSAGWPAAAPEPSEITDPAGVDPEVEAAPSEIESEREALIADEPAAPSAADEVDVAELEIETDAESSVEDVTTMSVGEEGHSAELPEPVTEPESPAESVFTSPEPEATIIGPTTTAPGPVAELEPEPEPPDSGGRAALIGMARIGGWDSVVDTLAERLAGEELGDLVDIIEELDQVGGFPIEIWRLLGDHYMRNRRPQLASEAYFRAVRRSS